MTIDDIAGSPDISQQGRMSTLMESLEYNNMGLLGWLIHHCKIKDHLTKLEEVLKHIQNISLQVNLLKSQSTIQELEYLSYWLMLKGIKPKTKQVKAILRLNRPKTLKQLRHFLDMISYFHDIWKWFDIQTDVCNDQLGTVISQKGKTIIASIVKDWHLHNKGIQLEKKTVLHCRNIAGIQRHPSRTKYHDTTYWS